MGDLVKDRQAKIAEEGVKDEVSTVRILVALLDLMVNLYKLGEKMVKEELGKELEKKLKKKPEKESEVSICNLALEWEYVHCTTLKASG